MPRGIYDRKPRPHSQELSLGDLSSTSEVSVGGTRIKVHIWPNFRGEDNGDGGVRRVVEAQQRYLPQFGIDVVDTPEEADVLACHIEMPTPWYKLYPDKPVVAMIHGLYWDDFEWQNWAREANAKVLELIRSSDAITAPTEWVANSIRRATSRPVSIIPHGVNVDDWQHNEDSLGYVLWNKTRPDPVCDPTPLNDVAKILPNVDFVSTFGDESIKNIVLTGKRSFQEAKKLIQRAGVYLATTKETFGIGTLEAMAAGIPVVGFKWGGQLDIVRDGYDGFLVPPGDIYNLALAIEGALRDRSLLAQHARERAAEFTWEKACEQYATLFREALERKTATDPRTSIIVTAYNLERYLPDTLASVAEQTDTNFECIVVDDASPDSCGEIADGWAANDKRFRVIHNSKNVYLAEARNIGIRSATGKYILCVDADDMLAPNAVSDLAAALDADRTIQVAYGGVRFVNQDGVTPTLYDGFRDNPGHSSWPYQFSFEQQIQQRNLLPYCSMYRRETWEYTGGYRPRCRTAEDADFWTRVSSYGFRPKMVTNADTLIYRNRHGSMSQEQGPVDWVKWFPWSKDKSLTPAGAYTGEQVPVPSFDRPIVSVIIPVGPDHRTLVKDAIDSVDAQSFRNWECIVINDSGQPLDEMPSWVRIIDTAGHTGAAAARNAGLRAAKAPLFLPLDADDYLQPNALQWLLQAYSDTKDIIYTDFWEDPDKPGDFRLYEMKDYDANNLTRGTIHCVTALTPKSVWEKVGGYDEALPGWEDWDFQIKVADAGICSRRLAAPLFVYRKHTGSRREANVRDFETSKNGILSKWGDLWSGRKQLMACSSCAARATIRPTQGPPLTAAQQAARLTGGDDDAVLIEYTGAKQGNVPFKGKSGTFYLFSANAQPRYVLSRDVDVFLNRQDFRVVPKPDPIAIENAQAPVLVAEGKPA